MKSFKNIAVALVTIAYAFTLHSADVGLGQISPSGKSHPSFWSYTNFLAPASTVSNIPVTAAYILAVPTSPWGAFTRIGGTNSLTTTGSTFVLEGIIKTPNGHTQVVDNATFSFVAAAGGTGGYDFVTNWLPLTDRILPALDGIRIRSVQNTNDTSAWVSNFFMVKPQN